MKALTLEHVSVRFGTVQALRDVSLSVKEGEIVMLVGPNGAGKSTLIRVLLGLVRPDSGRLVVDGKPRDVDNAFKAELGYLPEAVAFAENLSGRQVLSFFASARGTSRGRVDEVLQRVGLAHAARRAVRGYSRGMRQRLGLGLSILADPKLLILDEPTGGLDQEGLSVLWSVLTEWRERGRMVLLASHELTLMERRIDRMCVVHHGQAIADDTPGRIREQTPLPINVHVGVSTANGAANEMRARLSASCPSAAIRTEADELVVAVAQGELKALLAVASAAEGVSGLRVVEPGLDDVYEHLIGEAG
ncbi:MAG: ABC transporter ATP-binding protein [Polyangiaceae bacterium]